MSNSDVKRLLRKSKLSGKEAALLLIRNEWELETKGQGFLSDAEIAAAKSNIRPGQHAIYNDYMRLYELIGYAALDAGRLGLRIAASCGALHPQIFSYISERYMRGARSTLLPHVVTAQEYEERRLAQREHDLLEPVSLGHVLNWYLPQDELASERLLQEAESFEKDIPEDDQTYYEGLPTYVLREQKEPELARPWLEWLLEMLQSGRLEPVHYTEEASELAHGYLERNTDYASVYQEQSKRPGGRDTAALIKAIESYLAGELEPIQLDDRLWDTFVTGPEIYEAGLAKYQEWIDNYEPRPPEWPALAILQNVDSLEGGLLVDKETGRYRRESEDKVLRAITMHDAYLRVYSQVHVDMDDGYTGLDGYLVASRKLLSQHMQELLGFHLALQAASNVLGIDLLEGPGQDLEQGYEGIRRLNSQIRLARNEESVLMAREPVLPIEEIDISSLEPAERVVTLVQSRMGKLLPEGWAQQRPEPIPAAEEDAHEPA